MFFLARWQVVARIDHLFAQSVYRHVERWACMLCGCYSVLFFFDLRFIRHHPHPFLRAMNPIDRLEEDNRWLSRER